MYSVHTTPVHTHMGSQKEPGGGGAKFEITGGIVCKGKLFFYTAFQQ